MLRKLLLLLLLSMPVLASADALNDGLTAYDKKDYAKALQLLQPLADKGDTKAQLFMGFMHYHGLGVKESDVKALEWFGKAAARGSAEAQFQLAQMYTFGFGTRNEPDPDRKAAELYFQAAQQNHAEAQYSLGLMFLAGKGVEESREEAVKWIRRAADNGHPGARDFLGNYKK